MDTKSEVKKTIFQLRKEFGNVFSIDDIKRASPEVKKEDIRKVLDELKEEGIIGLLDDKTIQVNS